MARPFDDDFEFRLVTSFEGYVTSKDRTNVAANVMTRGSINIFKKDTGNISVRDGLKRYGLADSTIQGVVSAYEWDTSLATERPLRVLGETADGAADGKLQVMSTIVDGVTPIWYDLQIGLSLTRYVFDSYWDDTLKKDKLLMVRGDDNIYVWQGGVGKVLSAAAATITLTENPLVIGFLNPAGNVLINGVLYAYTGISGNDFTGVSPDPSAIPVDSVVLSEVTTTSDKPAADFQNDFIKVIGNQLYVGSYTSRLVYVSASDDYTDFTEPSPRSAGDPFILTLDDNPRGITVRQGNAHIPGGLFSWYVVQFQDITVGSTLTQSVQVDKQEVAAQTTALAHEFIDTVGDDIYYLDQENQVRIYGIFRNIVQAKYPSISQQIRQELEVIDFTGGALRAIGDYVYITAPLLGIAYYHQTRESVDGNGNVIAERLWHPPQTWSASRIALINGIEYVHSSVNPQLYQIYDTFQWHDDSPSDEPLSYIAVMALSYQQTDRRQGMSALDKYYFEGYMTEGTTLLGYLLADYQGFSGKANLVISSPANQAHFFQSNSAPSLGDSSLGDNPLGITLSAAENAQEDLPKFRAITDIGQVNCFEYQIIVYSQEADSRWEILALGPNAQITQNEQSGFLRK